MLNTPVVLAQSGRFFDSSNRASGSENPISVINARLRDHLDVLNHPDPLSDIVTNINLVWAVIFVLVGATCVINGYRWHKTVITVLAGMSGVYAGMLIGEHVGDTTIASACLALLFVILAWPLMRYSAALFGGLAGAFAGANIWTAVGADAEMHHVGAIIGLVVVGMLAFLTFRAVVIVLTAVGGAALFVLGGMALLMQIGSFRGGVLDGISDKPMIVPVVAGSAALIGAIVQFGGGLKGMNEMANKADTKGKKPAPA
ncbi:MAG: hypothetical protein RLN60_01960 [Phycisphaerales bacterium]